VEDDVTVTHEDLKPWKTKALQGKFPHCLQENYMDKESSLLWLFAGCIYPEMIHFAAAIQDWVIKTESMRCTA